jgi:hypothetical protein
MRRLTESFIDLLLLILMGVMVMTGVLFFGTFIYSAAHGWSNLTQLVVSGLVFGVCFVALRLAAKAAAVWSGSRAAIDPAHDEGIGVITYRPSPSEPRKTFADEIREAQKAALAQSVFLERRKV